MGDGQVVQQGLMLQAAAGSTVLDATVEEMSLGIELGCELTGIDSMQRCQAKYWTGLITA